MNPPPPPPAPTTDLSSYFSTVPQTLPLNIQQHEQGSTPAAVPSGSLDVTVSTYARGRIATTARRLDCELQLLSFAGQSVRRNAEVVKDSKDATNRSQGDLPPLKRDPRPGRLPAKTCHEERNLCPHGVPGKDPVPQPRSHVYLWHVLNSRPLHDARCREILKANGNAPVPDPRILDKPWSGLLPWYLDNAPGSIESAADLHGFMDAALPPPPDSLFRSWADAPYAIRCYVFSEDGASAEEVIDGLDELIDRAQATRDPVLVVKAPCMRSDGTGLAQVSNTPYGVFSGHLRRASRGAGISFVILMEMRPVECFHKARQRGCRPDKIASCHPAHKQELQPGADWFFLVGGGLLRLLRAKGIEAIVLGVGKAAAFSMQDCFDSSTSCGRGDSTTPPGVRRAAPGLVVIDDGVIHTSEARNTSSLAWLKYGATIAVAAAVLRGGGGGGGASSCPGQRAFLEFLEKSPILAGKTATPFLNQWLRLLRHCAWPRARHKRGGVLWWSQMSASALPLLTTGDAGSSRGASVLRAAARGLSDVATGTGGFDKVHELWLLLPGADLDLVWKRFRERKATCLPSELAAYKLLLLKSRSWSGEGMEDEFEEWDDEEGEEEEDQEDEEEGGGLFEDDEYDDEELGGLDDWDPSMEDIIVDTSEEQGRGDVVTVTSVVRDAVEVLRQVAKETEEQLPPGVEEQMQRVAAVFNPPAHCGANCCGQMRPHRSPGTTWAMHPRRHFLEAIGRQALGSLTDAAKEGIAEACGHNSSPLVRAAAGIKAHLERYRGPLTTTTAPDDICNPGDDPAPIAPERMDDDLEVTDEEARLLTHARFYAWYEKAHCLVRVPQSKGADLWTSKDESTRRYFVLGSCGRSRDNANFHVTHTGGYQVMASIVATAKDLSRIVVLEWDLRPQCVHVPGRAICCAVIKLYELLRLAGLFLLAMSVFLALLPLNQNVVLVALGVGPSDIVVRQFPGSFGGLGTGSAAIFANTDKTPPVIPVGTGPGAPRVTVIQTGSYALQEVLRGGGHSVHLIERLAAAEGADRVASVALLTRLHAGRVPKVQALMIGDDEDFTPEEWFAMASDKRASAVWHRNNAAADSPEMRRAAVRGDCTTELPPKNERGALEQVGAVSEHEVRDAAGRLAGADPRVAAELLRRAKVIGGLVQDLQAPAASINEFDEKLRAAQALKSMMGKLSWACCSKAGEDAMSSMYAPDGRTVLDFVDEAALGKGVDKSLSDAVGLLLDLASLAGTKAKFERIVDLEADGDAAALFSRIPKGLRGGPLSWIWDATGPAGRQQMRAALLNVRGVHEAFHAKVLELGPGGTPEQLLRRLPKGLRGGVLDGTWPSPDQEGEQLKVMHAYLSVMGKAAMIKEVFYKRVEKELGPGVSPAELFKRLPQELRNSREALGCNWDTASEDDRLIMMRTYVGMLRINEAFDRFAGDSDPGDLFAAMLADDSLGGGEALRQEWEAAGPEGRQVMREKLVFAARAKPLLDAKVDDTEGGLSSLIDDQLGEGWRSSANGVTVMVGIAEIAQAARFDTSTSNWYDEHRHLEFRHAVSRGLTTAALNFETHEDEALLAAVQHHRSKNPDISVPWAAIAAEHPGLQRFGGKPLRTRHQFLTTTPKTETGCARIGWTGYVARTAMFSAVARTGCIWSKVHQRLVDDGEQRITKGLLSPDAYRTRFGKMFSGIDARLRAWADAGKKQQQLDEAGADFKLRIGRGDAECYLASTRHLRWMQRRDQAALDGELSLHELGDNILLKSTTDGAELTQASYYLLNRMGPSTPVRAVKLAAMLSANRGMVTIEIRDLIAAAAKGALRRPPPPAAREWLDAALKLLLPRPARNAVELRGLAQVVSGQEACAAALLLLAPGDKMAVQREEAGAILRADAGRFDRECPAWRSRVPLLRGAVEAAVQMPSSRQQQQQQPQPRRREKTPRDLTPWLEEHLRELHEKGEQAIVSEVYQAMCTRFADHRGGSPPLTVEQLKNRLSKSKLFTTDVSKKKAKNALKVTLPLLLALFGSAPRYGSLGIEGGDVPRISSIARRGLVDEHGAPRNRLSEMLLATGHSFQTAPRGGHLHIRAPLKPPGDPDTTQLICKPNSRNIAMRCPLLATLRQSDWSEEARQAWTKKAEEELGLLLPGADAAAAGPRF